MIASCSKLLAQMPMMKPNRLKATDVSTMKATIQPGWRIRTGTKNVAVMRMISPIATDLVAAAPTKLATISIAETGADSTS